jgi:hypothetical protein
MHSRTQPTRLLVRVLTKDGTSVARNCQKCMAQNLVGERHTPDAADRIQACYIVRGGVIVVPAFARAFSDGGQF